MKKMILISVLILVVFVSGCTNQTAFFSGYETEVKEESADIVIIEPYRIIPDLIYGEETFDVDFQISNSHETRDVETAEVWIENWEPCEITYVHGVSGTDDVFGDSPAFYPGLENDGTSDDPDFTIKLSAGASAPISLIMLAKTPTPDLPGTCDIIYRVNYGFEAVTSYTGITLMETTAYREMLRSGTYPAEKPVEYIGTGPIRLVFSTDTKFPVESIAGRKISMDLVIENKGHGSFAKVLEGDVSLTIPKDLTPDTIVDNLPSEGNDLTDVEGICDRFKRYAGEEGDYYIFKNHKNITLQEGKSTTLRCRLNAFVESGSLPYEKSYYITAKYNYDYTVRGTIPVNIKAR